MNQKSKDMWFSPMTYSIQRYVIFNSVKLLLWEKWCPMKGVLKSELFLYSLEMLNCWRASLLCKILRIHWKSLKTMAEAYHIYKLMKLLKWLFNHILSTLITFRIFTPYLVRTNVVWMSPLTHSDFGTKFGSCGPPFGSTPNSTWPDFSHMFCLCHI